MKFYLWISLLASFSLLGQQQTDVGIAFNEGKIFKSNHKKYKVDSRIGDNNGGAYIILNRPGTNIEVNYIVQHISSSLAIDSEVSFDFNKERIVSHFLIEQNFHFITSVINKTLRQLEFKVYTSSDYGKTYLNKKFLTIPIDELNIEIGFSKFIKFIKPNFVKNDTADKDRKGFLSFSEKKNFFALSFDIPETSEDEHLFYVFDNNFDLEHKTLYQPQIDDDNYDFIDIAVDDTNGDLFVLLKKILKKTFLGDGVRSYNFNLIKISKNNIETFPLEKEGISFGQIRLKLDKTDNSLKALGTYSEKSDYFDRGIAFIGFKDNDLSNYDITLSPFSDTFLEQKFGKKKKKKELSKYFLRSILQKDNGNYVLMSEELDIQSRRLEFGIRNSDFFYQFKDILVAEISNAGKLLWSRNISKHQEVSSLAYIPVSSFSASILHDNIYIILNAKKVHKKKKINLFFSSSPYPAKQYIINIDDEGTMGYSEFSASNTKLVFASGEAMYSSKENPSSLILQGQNLYKRQFLKIKFPKE